jgi:hypothetical protein
MVQTATKTDEDRRYATFNLDRIQFRIISITEIPLKLMPQGTEVAYAVVIDQALRPDQFSKVGRPLAMNLRKRFGDSVKKYVMPEYKTHVEVGTRIIKSPPNTIVLWVERIPFSMRVQKERSEVELGK